MQGKPGLMLDQAHECLANCRVALCDNDVKAGFWTLTLAEAAAF
jgi:hypothetical protein